MASRLRVAKCPASPIQPVSKCYDTFQTARKLTLPIRFRVFAHNGNSPVLSALLTVFFTIPRMALKLCVCCGEWVSNMGVSYTPRYRARRREGLAETRERS